MKLILKHDDKKINYTNFPWIVLWSTQISRAKKFIEITIVVKDFDCWKRELHPLLCGSPCTSYRFIIKFIIVVSFYFNRFAKQTTNCKTLGEGTNIYRLNFFKMSTTSSWFNVRIKLVIQFWICLFEMHPINTNGMDFELNKTSENYLSKSPL